MGYPVTTEPTQAFVDAVQTRLAADSGLTAIIGTRLYAALPKSARVTLPYLVLGRRSVLRDAGPMATPAGLVSLTIEGWSSARGPDEMARMLSRVSAVLERETLSVDGHDMVDGSLTCEMSEVMDEPDQDMPDRVLFHGVQRWSAEIHQT